MKRCLAMVVLALVFISCLSEGEQPPKHIPDGGGSDTETLTGFVTSGDGLAAIGVPVKLLPSSFDPSLADTATLRRTLTDSLGRFRFVGVDSTQGWNLIAGDPMRKTWSFATEKRAGDSVALTLSPAKVMLVTLHSSTYSASDSGIAFFPGTDILTRCDGRTASRIDSIPAGASRLVLISRAGWRHDTTLVNLGDTTRVRADRDRVLITP